MGQVKKPIVQDGTLWTKGKEAAGSHPISLNSPSWTDWLEQHKQFKFKSAAGHFSARRESRSNGDYWYAYRRRDGKLHKSYLGKSEEITQAQLEETAAQLAGKTILKQLTLPTKPSAPQQSPIRAAFPRLTKIRPPILPPNLIIRSRLTEKLDSPVTFICAPGGFGKSTLLNDWQRNRVDMPIAWVSVDTEDDQLLRFWSTVFLALQAVLPRLGNKLLPYLQGTSSVSPFEIVSRLTNEIIRVTEGQERIGLIVDDFHRVQNPDIHNSIQAWLENLPPNLQLIISGRTRPPIALGRLRAHGMVTELEMDDLRFTLDEGIAFLQRHISDPPLAYSDMDTLVKRTGGWVAGLMLAVSALNKQQNRRHFLDSFNGAHLFLREYFLESVLLQQPAAVRNFLLKTSILKQLTGSLCDAVTGRSDGAQMLDRLWQENLFMVRAEEPDWYHYHDLFAEMLRNQLQTQSPELVPDLHRRAAAWYRQKQASADAVRHLLAIEDWEEAASLIEDVMLNELAKYGEDSRLLRWIQKLPESVFQHHKTLLFAFLRLARLAMHPADVELFLQHIETNLINKPDSQMTTDEREVLAEIRAIKRRKLAGTVNISSTQVADPRWQLLDALWIVEASYAPQTSTIGTQLYKIYEQALEQGNLFVVLIAGGDCANRAYLRGELRQSEKIVYQVLQYALAKRGGQKLPEPASIALSVLSKVFLMRNELEQASQLMQQATAVDPNPTASNMLINLAIARAALESAQKSHDVARSTIQAARDLQSQRPSRAWRDQDLAVYEALYCVRLEEWAEAERLLNEVTDENHALSRLVKAEMYLRQGMSASAENLLQELASQYPHSIPGEPALVIKVMYALVLYKQHKFNQARQLLLEVMRTAAPERFIRPFLNFGLEMVPFLALLKQTETLNVETSQFIQEILQTLGGTEDMVNLLPQENLDALIMAASITAREQEVLQLVGHGLSNREIAVQLCIAPGTVKTHLANIYSKLNVNNRVQAVAEAQTLQLI